MLLSPEFVVELFFLKAAKTSVEKLTVLFFISDFSFFDAVKDFESITF